MHTLNIIVLDTKSVRKILCPDPSDKILGTSSLLFSRLQFDQGVTCHTIFFLEF